MTWISVKAPRPRPHSCDLPDDEEVTSKGAASGSIWSCDECGKPWMLAEGAWSPITRPWKSLQK